MRLLRLLAGVALAGFLTAGAATAQPRTVTGTLDLDSPGAVIQPEVYGHFMEQLGSGITGGIWVGPDSDIPNTRGFRNDVVAALRALEVPVVRWPGGCYADIYDWRGGIGPRGDRPVTLNRWWGGTEEDNAFGTHEFFDFAELIGAKTYLSINVGTGTPQQAADWIEYVTSDSQSSLARERRANGREQPWRLDYIGVGNEPWGCGGRMRAAYYTDLLRHYAGFIAPFGQESVIIAAGPSGDDYDWTRTLMRDGMTNFEQLSVHNYTLPTGDWAAKGAATGFPVEEWVSTFDNAYRIEAIIAGHSAVMDEYDPDGTLGIAVDEWGAWYDPTPGSPDGHLQQQNSVRDALVAAAHFNIFHRHAGRVHMSNIAQMVNVLQALILTDGADMVLTPTYHAFMLYKPFQNAGVLPLTLDDGDAGERPMVDGTAARGADGRVHLALINLDPVAGAAIGLEMDGAARIVQARILTAGAMDAHNTFANPDRVTPRPFDGARLSDGRLAVELPAHSLVVITLEPSAP